MGWGHPTGGGGQYGGPDPSSGYTGQNVLGFDLAGDYANNIGQRHLTTRHINCHLIQHTRLAFWRTPAAQMRPKSFQSSLVLGLG